MSETIDWAKPLAQFGAWCLEQQRDGFGDLDGGELQDAAERFGLLRGEEVTEDNAELHINCEDIEVGDTCYHLAPGVEQAMAELAPVPPANRGEGEAT